jgi:hypothetical protein
MATAQQSKHITRTELAQLLQDRGQEMLDIVVASLRQEPPEPSPAGSGSSNPSPRTPAAGTGRLEPWRQVGVIEGFEHTWPEGREQYAPMTVWESRDEIGPVRLAIGSPLKRLHLYGKERGWVSVWEVINGQPREQRANFIEADDFEETGERIAIITGKGGSKKQQYEPEDRDLLPPIYDDMRIEVQRDRCNGPQGRNRLGVVATDEETDVMLDHALNHLRLRS